MIRFLNLEYSGVLYFHRKSKPERNPQNEFLLSPDGGIIGRVGIIYIAGMLGHLTQTAVNQGQLGGVRGAARRAVHVCEFMD